MITKGIIKALPSELGSNKYSVVIPYFQKAGVDYSEGSISTQVREATCCNTPGIDNGLHVDDVVFISFEDNKLDKPVIIGKLFIETSEKSPADISGNSLYISNGAELNGPITINGIDFTNIDKSIRKLLNTGDDIQLKLINYPLSLTNQGWNSGLGGVYYKTINFSDLGLNDNEITNTNCKVYIDLVLSNPTSLSSTAAVNADVVKSYQNWLNNDLYCININGIRNRIEICCWSLPPTPAMNANIKIIYRKNII